MRWSFWLFLKLVFFRIVNALLVQTFFQPDEFFQSLEVAHELVFRYGWLTWEWQPENAIRSPLYPLLFVPGYWLVQKLGLEDTDALTIAPKVVQGVIAAVNDYYTARLAVKLFDSPLHGQVALFCSVASFFNGGVTVRTFSNSLETALTAAALSKWPWTTRGGYGSALCLAGLACIVRPTNAIIWFFLAGHAVLRGRSFTTRLIKTGLLPLLGSIGLCLGLDSWYYGYRVFTPLNFYRVNVANNISVFYGANAWHYYLTQGIPFDLLALVPFLLHGTWLTFTRTPVPGLNVARNTAIWTICILSLISHKEFRFIQPLLPILHILAAHSLVKLAHLSQETAVRSRLIPALRRSHVALILGVNITAIFLFIAVHMRGQVGVTRYLHSLPRRELHSIFFAMPCHSTPWQSYIHKLRLDDRINGYEAKLFALTCEPPLGRNVTTYRDQTHVFYDDPHAWMRSTFTTPESLARAARYQMTHAGPERWPSHIVLFDELLHRVEPPSKQPFASFLAEYEYVEEKRIWNSFWHEEPKRAGDIVIFKRTVGGW